MAELTVERILSDLRAQASPGAVSSMGRFFKEPVPALGLTNPQLRAYSTGLYRQMRHCTPAERNRLCTKLWQCGYHEGGLLVTYVYKRWARSCGADEFRLFEGWVRRYAMSWAHVDAVGTWLLAASIANQPELALELPDWTTSPNRWVRRAAAVSLIYEAKQGRQLPVILEVSRRLAADPDDLVRKGVGWLLKESYEKSPAGIVAFLAAQEFPRLVLRYAAEKMTPRDRRAVLG